MDCRAVVLESTAIESYCPEIDLRADEIVFDTVDLGQDPAIDSMLRDLFAIRSNPHVSAFAIDCLVSTLVGHLLQRHRHSDSDRFRRVSNSGRFPGAIAKAKAVIREHVAEPSFRLDDLARLTGLSKFHLLRFFKRAVGVTPLRYRNLLRLELAAGRLERGNCRVGDIVADLGWNDLSTYYKARKRSR